MPEAITELECSPRRLELAKALVDHGSWLRRHGQRAGARDPLRRALEIAAGGGALAVVDRARTELAATGSRVRRTELSGPGALTPSERRIAEMACAGASNPEIAQALFVTVKTVEMHLSNIYRKLDIRSRQALAGALSTGAKRPSSRTVSPG